MPNRRVFRVLGKDPMATVAQFLKLRPHRTMDSGSFFAVGTVIVRTGEGRSATLEDEKQTQDIYFSFTESFPAPPANRDFTKKIHLAFTKNQGKEVVVREYTTKSKDKLVLADVYEGEDGSCELVAHPSEFMEVDASRFTDGELAISGIPSLDPVQVDAGGH